MNKILILFPCYNEEEVITHTLGQITLKLKDLISSQLISAESKVCFIDDGSKDKTWQLIESFDNPFVNGIKLSRNTGHQYALLAGLETTKNKYDAYITMDVDLQDDINAIDKMISEYIKGNDVVYGVRNDRSNDTFFKRKTAEAFYKIMNKLGVKTVFNHADFRLISNRALLEFLKYKETHLFLRGIFPLVGFNQSSVYYKRKERSHGVSKYPLRKMLSFAWEGITSFSDKPIRFIMVVGILSVLISIILALWAFITLILGNTIKGWTSIIILIVFFGGIQTISLGIIGEYIGKIYIQSKNRPRYGVDKVLNL